MSRFLYLRSYRKQEGVHSESSVRQSINIALILFTDPCNFYFALKVGALLYFACFKKRSFRLDKQISMSDVGYNFLPKAIVIELTCVFALSLKWPHDTSMMVGSDWR